MKRLKSALAAATFVIAFGLFGAPNAPVGNLVPTVGGEAHAYAPCQDLYLIMHQAIAAYFANPNWRTLADLHDAITNFFHCWA